MKIKLVNNAELVIQANVNKEGDYQAALARAERIVEASCGSIDIACVEESEQWVHLCADWDHYKADELKAEYQNAK